MTSTPSVFPFLQLPRELRDIIYKYWHVYRLLSGVETNSS
jgi:hypothetical protein